MLAMWKTLKISFLFFFDKWFCFYRCLSSKWQNEDTIPGPPKHPKSCIRQFCAFFLSKNNHKYPSRQVKSPSSKKWEVFFLLSKTCSTHLHAIKQIYRPYVVVKESIAFIAGLNKENGEGQLMPQRTRLPDGVQGRGSQGSVREGTAGCETSSWIILRFIKVKFQALSTFWFQPV